MRRTLILLAWIILCWSVSSSARAQPPHPHGPHPEPKPPATVVARVNVNVETEVDVAHGSATADDNEEEEDEEEEEGEEKPELSDLVASVLEQAGGRSGVVVIADVNVNVKTSVKVRVNKSSTPSQTASASAAHKAEQRNDEPKPAAESAAPHRKKKHGRRQNRKPAEEEAAEIVPPEENRAGITLNRLKIGDRLELGVSSQLSSEQRAQQIADQINLGRSRTLLGLALAGGLLPDQTESLGVVQKAVASVNAQSAGSELSVSVAIPKETPSAIRTLVEAAIRQ